MNHAHSTRKINHRRDAKAQCSKWTGRARTSLYSLRRHSNPTLHCTLNFTHTPTPYFQIREKKVWATYTGFFHFLLIHVNTGGCGACLHAAGRHVLNFIDCRRIIDSQSDRLRCRMTGWRVRRETRGAPPWCGARCHRGTRSRRRRRTGRGRWPGCSSRWDCTPGRSAAATLPRGTWLVNWTQRERDDWKLVRASIVFCAHTRECMRACFNCDESVYRCLWLFGWSRRRTGMWLAPSTTGRPTRAKPDLWPAHRSAREQPAPAPAGSSANLKFIVV